MMTAKKIPTAPTVRNLGELSDKNMPYSYSITLPRQNQEGGLYL